MEVSTIISMIIGIIIVWGLPIGVIVSLVVLFKKVNRVEKKLNK